MALDTKEPSACFLGGIMLEGNSAVLYRNEDLLCTFVLKVILLTHPGLGVGEIMPAKFFPQHLPCIHSP